jgi:hypothetical protein
MFLPKLSLRPTTSDLRKTNPSSGCTADGWFADHFGAPLPRGLRDSAATMSWEAFVETYGHTVGPLRLGHWACTDGGRRPGPQARNFQAMIAVGDRINTSTAAASGPIAALTAMLYERGITLEILSFHQIRADGRTATFIRGGDGVGVEWALGMSRGASEDPDQSALRALIACANRLWAMRRAA